MSATIKEVFMDWLGINEFHNVRIDSKSKCYADTLSCSEEFYLIAKTNVDDGTAVDINLNILDKNKTLLKTVELESHVENEEVKMTLKVEELAKENDLDLSAIKEINAVFHHEKEKYPTNTARVSRTLKSKELSENGMLNDIVEDKEKKAYKKTAPLMKGEEVKRIQEALQKMKIDIGEDGIDGVFGNDGHNAVMTFQENFKPTYDVHQYTWAEPDGIVGKNTLLAMDEALVGGWRYELCCGKEFKNKIQCTRYGSIYGPAYWGDLKLANYPDWDVLVNNGKVTEEEKDIIIGMSENEGKLDSVQSYDSEIVTIGAMQKTINPMGRGELAIQIEEFKLSNPEKYTSLFSSCGWTVENSKMYYQDPTDPTASKLTGSSLKTLIRKGYDASNFKKYTVRCKPLEALVRAAKDKDFQTKQVIDFIDRLKEDVLTIRPKGYPYELNQYLKSKLGKATALDQHINRPAYVANDFSLALNNFFRDNPTVSKNPATWDEQHAIYESIIVNDYGITRRGTEMSVRYNKLKKAFK